MASTTVDTLGSSRLNNYPYEVRFPDVCLSGESTFLWFSYGVCCMSGGAESLLSNLWDTPTVSRMLPLVSSVGLSSPRCQSNAAFPPTPAGLSHWPPCLPLSSVPASPKYLVSDFVSPPNSKILLCNCQMDISAGFFYLRILTFSFLDPSVSLPVSNNGTSIHQRPSGEEGWAVFLSHSSSLLSIIIVKIRKQ